VVFWGLASLLLAALGISNLRRVFLPGLTPTSRFSTGC
jgi:hypothetical protein